MTLFVLMILLAASVWAIPIMKRWSVLTGLAGTVFVGILFGPPFFSIQGPIQLSLDRLLVLVSVGWMAIEWRAGTLAKPAWGRHDFVLTALVAWLFLRVLGTDAPPEETPPMSRWLTYFVMPWMVYMMMRCVPLTDLALRRLLNVMLGLGCYVAAIGIFEVTGFHGLVFPRYIVDPQYWEFLGRARGPLMNPAGNGVFLTSTLAIGCHRWIHAGRLGKVGYLCLIALIGAGCLATLTRSVWLGVIVFAAVLSMVYLSRSARALSLVACLVIGMLSITGFGSIMEIKRDKDMPASEAAKSVELRPPLLIVAWEMFKDRPLMGHGYGGYFETSPEYHSRRTWDMPLDKVRPYMQHNVITSLAVDSGLIGATCFIIWNLVVTSMSWRLMSQRRTNPELRCLGTFTIGCVCGYFVNGMLHDVSVMPMLNSLLMLAGALTTNAVVAGDSATRVTPRMDRRAAAPAWARPNATGVPGC